MKNLEKQWKSYDDEKRWKWVQNNQHLGITVMLDNDDTFIIFSDMDNDYSLSFDNYIGSSYGVVYLLKAMNIRCDEV